MQAFSRVTGTAAPLLLTNVDTDVIIRIERLTTLSRNELGRFAFEALRYSQPDVENPAFVLNQKPYRNAPILLAGANFGCGSSREGAVWAILDAGISCVIAPSFGNIFYSNCFQNGLLPIVLEERIVSRLAAAAASGHQISVDLESQCITVTDGTSTTADSIGKCNLMN